MYVGIDLHRKRSQVCALDEAGCELLSRSIANDPGQLLELLGQLGDDPVVALEAAYGWEWLADLLDEQGIPLSLAHPLRTRAIASARVKTDAVDARTLAHLLRADLLPEAWIAPQAVRDLRECLRQRVVLTNARSALKNRVHALLARQGIQHGYADLFGKAGRAFLTELELRSPQRTRLDTLLRLIDAFDSEIRALAAEITDEARRDPRVQTLCRLPGIGPYTALLVIA